VGKGTFAFAVLTPTVLAACGGSDDESPTSEGASPSDTTAAGSDTTAAGSPTPAGGELTWARANLGFVSAYVLARGDKAAIVDTGVAGSAGDIGMTLGELGMSYDDVDSVILTHYHGDHAGSIAEVLQMAGGATAYAGEADLGRIEADGIMGVTGGSDVFGLEVIDTPGHTEGHISVIDHDAGILVAGDAINGVDGGVTGPNPEFSTDHDLATESAKALGALTFNTLLFGHGDPIESDADTAVAALAATL